MGNKDNPNVYIGIRDGGNGDLLNKIMIICKALDTFIKYSCIPFSTVKANKNKKELLSISSTYDKIYSKPIIIRDPSAQKRIVVHNISDTELARKTKLEDG